MEFCSRWWQQQQQLSLHPMPPPPPPPPIPIPHRKIIKLWDRPFPSGEIGLIRDVSVEAAFKKDPSFKITPSWIRTGSRQHPGFFSRNNNWFVLMKFGVNNKKTTFYLGNLVNYLKVKAIRKLIPIWQYIRSQRWEKINPNPKLPCSPDLGNL